MFTLFDDGTFIYGAIGDTDDDIRGRWNTSDGRLLLMVEGFEDSDHAYQLTANDNRLTISEFAGESRKVFERIHS